MMEFIQWIGVVMLIMPILTFVALRIFDDIKRGVWRWQDDLIPLLIAVYVAIAGTLLVGGGL